MKLVFGVGIYDLRGDSSHISKKTVDGKVLWHCPIYRKWLNIHKRCYSEKWLQQKPSYRGCSVCEEWKTFSNFMAWMKTQPWEGKQLDKDILVPGNKVYSPETCVFVSANLNKLLNNGTRGKYPVGVSYNKPNKSFQAEITKFGKKYRIGTFVTPEEAHEAYKKERSKYILEVAENLTEDDTSDIERTRQGLIRHVEEGYVFR